MKFKVSKDVAAPKTVTWAQYTDFNQFEADARNRGADLIRVGNWERPSEGVEWRGEATIRGKQRAIAARLSRLDPEDMFLVDSRIGGMNCHYELTFIPLSSNSTRVAMVLELKADTLTARLLLQTMKLARGRVLQRLQTHLARQAKGAEARYKQQFHA